MPYAQIDTDALTHPKVSSLSDAAFRVWVAALAYCQRHLTDGALPGDGLHGLGVRVTGRITAELVAKQLWDRTDDGYQVHDYLQWNTSRAEVEAKRAEARDRMAKRRAQSSLEPPDPPPGVRANNSRTTVELLENHARTSTERSQNVPYSVQRTAGSGGEGELEREGPRPPAPGHQQHVFCGRRFCVPRWLDAEFRAGLGPDALDRYDLDAWYACLDEDMAASGQPLLPDPKAWLQGRYREVLRDTFGEPARRLRRVR